MNDLDPGEEISSPMSAFPSAWCASGADGVHRGGRYAGPMCVSYGLRFALIVTR